MGPVGLFDEGPDQPVLPGDGEAVAQRLALPGEGERRGGPALPVPPPERAQIEVAGRVPADDQHVLLPDELPAAPHRPRGTPGAGLDLVAQRDTEAPTVPEVVDDILRAVAQGGADLREAAAPQVQQRVFHQRPAEQGDHGFWRVAGHSLEPGAVAAGQKNRFHFYTPLSLLV